METASTLNTSEAPLTDWLALAVMLGQPFGELAAAIGAEDFGTMPPANGAERPQCKLVLTDS